MLRRSWIDGAMQAVVARISEGNDLRLAPAPGLELTQLEDRFMLSASPLPVEGLAGADVGGGGETVTTPAEQLDSSHGVLADAEESQSVAAVRQDPQAKEPSSSQRAAQQNYLEQVRLAQQDVLSAVQAEYQEILRMNLALESTEFSQHLDNSNLTSAEKDRLSNSTFYFSVMGDLAQGIVDGDVDAVKTSAPQAFEAQSWAPRFVDFADAEGYALLPHLWAIPENLRSMNAHELQTAFDDVHRVVGEDPSEYFQTIQNDAADHVLAVQASMRQVNVDLKMLEYQFPFFDANLYKDAPDLQTELGMDPIQMVYARALWERGSPLDQPDEAKVREVARGLSGDQFTVVDVERWKTHIGVSSEEAAESMAKLVRIVDWMHEENPNLLLGYYSVAPSADWPANLRPDSPRGERLAARNDELQTVADAVDIIFPSLYTVSQNPDWDLSSINSISEARQYGKTVIPFLWPEYHPNSDEAPLEYFPVEMWVQQLETLKEHADGIVFWSDPQPWTGDYEWIEPTRAFIDDLHSTTDSDPNLVGHWSFNGAVLDQSGNGNDGTMVDNPVFVVGPDGTLAGAVQFDGSNDAVSLGSASVLNPGTSDFTVMAWIQMDSDAEVDRSIFSKQMRGSGWNFNIDGDTQAGAIELNVTDGANMKITGQTDLRDGGWHHVAIVKVGSDRTNWRLYEDGASAEFTEGRGDGTGGSVSTTAAAYIGQRAWPGSALFFDGSIDDVRFYTRALSTVEIQQARNENLPTPDTTPPSVTLTELTADNAGETSAPLVVAAVETPSETPPEPLVASSTHPVHTSGDTASDVEMVQDAETFHVKPASVPSRLPTVDHQAAGFTEFSRLAKGLDVTPAQGVNLAERFAISDDVDSVSDGEPDATADEKGDLDAEVDLAESRSAAHRAKAARRTPATHLSSPAVEIPLTTEIPILPFEVMAMRDSGTLEIEILTQ